MDGYWFKSSKFEIEPGEDEDINPAVAKLYADLGRILRAEPQIQLVDEP